MPICSYLVVPQAGATTRVGRRLSALRGCDVVEAENRDLLILVTDTPDLEAEEALRREVEEMEGIEALLLTFGEIDPETELADPISVGRSKRSRDGRGAGTRPKPSRQEAG